MFSRKTIANDRASTDRLPCLFIKRGFASPRMQSVFA